MIANFNGKCRDNCGLPIHAGHDEVERGHFGWRHVDCERANVRAQIREKLTEGWTMDSIWTWLERAEHLSMDERVDGIFYAKVMAPNAACCDGSVTP